MTPFSPLSPSSTLPDETWSEILRFLSFKLQSHGLWKDSIKQKDLSSCSLVCTKWYQLVQPLLLEHISLNGREDNFWRMKQVGRLGCAKGAGDRVKTLAANGYLTGESFNDELLKSVVEASVNLTEAHFEVCNVDMGVLVRSSGHLKHLHLLNCQLEYGRLLDSNDLFPTLTHLAIVDCSFPIFPSLPLLPIFRTPSNFPRCPLLEGFHLALANETACPSIRNGLSITLETYCKSLKCFSGFPSLYEPRFPRTLQSLPRLERLHIQLGTLTKYDWQLLLFTRVNRVYIACEEWVDFSVLLSLLFGSPRTSNSQYVVESLTVVSSFALDGGLVERLKKRCEGLRMKFEIVERFNFVKVWEEGSPKERFFFGGKSVAVA